MIRSIISQAAAEQGLTAYAIAKRANKLARMKRKPGITSQHVRRYLTGRADITTAKADLVLRSLGISLVWSHSHEQ